MVPPAGRRIGDDFVDDSDSDVSIGGLDEDTGRSKAKGKGKAVDTKPEDAKKDKDGKPILNGKKEDGKDDCRCTRVSRVTIVSMLNICGTAAEELNEEDFFEDIQVDDEDWEISERGTSSLVR